MSGPWSPELLSCLSLFDRTLSAEFFFPNSLSGSLYCPDTEHLRQAQLVLHWCYDNDVQIVHPASDFYPEAFHTLEKPPLFLSVRGNLEALTVSKARLAVVGTREPSRRTLEWLDHHLAGFLAKRPDAIIVSGGARGVDQKAHRVTIRHSASTIVFLPSGLNQIYPREILEWEQPLLAAGGALVSPYAPNQTIRRTHFEGRNRLIAALSDLVLVAEARRRSGSIMTARLANELGRTLAVLPSFPGEPRAMGTLDLLFNGAFPIRDAEDLSTLLEPLILRLAIAQPVGY